MSCPAGWRCSGYCSANWTATARRSIPALLPELGEIRALELLYSARREDGQPTIQTTCLSRMTDEQRRMFAILVIGHYLVQTADLPR